MKELRTLTVTLPGKPLARVNPRRVGRIYYDPQKAFKNDIRFFFQITYPRFNMLSGPLYLEFIFHLEMPNSWSIKKKILNEGKLHTSKPDTSNMLKLIEDCCTGIFFKDDCQIAMIHGKKIWSTEPRTELIIREMNE